MFALISAARYYYTYVTDRTYARFPELKLLKFRESIASEAGARKSCTEYDKRYISCGVAFIFVYQRLPQMSACVLP